MWAKPAIALKLEAYLNEIIDESYIRVISTKQSLCIMKFSVGIEQLVPREDSLPSPWDFVFFKLFADSPN